METCLRDVFNAFSTHTKKPEQFLSVQEDVAQQLKKTIKKLYDITKSLESSTGNEALSELIVENFDDEQVWQEIELQNEPVMNEQIKQISKVTASSDTSFLPKRKTEQHARKSKRLKTDQEDSQEDFIECEEYEADSEGAASFNSGADEDEDLSEEEQELEELLKKAKEEMDNVSDDEDDDDDDDLNEDFDLTMDKLRQERSDLGHGNSSSKGPKKSAVKKRTSVVDDKFFKLADMEMFLEQEDAKEEKKMSGRPEDSDEEIDYFVDQPSDDEDSQNLKYDDFFDPPDEVNDMEQDKSRKSVKFTKHERKAGDGNDDSDDDDSETDGDDDDNVEGEDVTDVVGAVRGEKSSFEKRQERIKKKISELEEAALAEKPWQLQGEVSSQSRPENSLLEEDLDYERTTRLAPVITEETTKALEDVIKQRIKDKAWDDVERKVKPADEPYEYKKKIVLDQEKSKLSLSQLYEQEYIKQQQKEQEERTDPEHEEIKKMMTSLFLKLDALSNFHYTPKPAVPEVKIVSNLPSITMEEVAPVNVSDATLLAPTEIQEKPKTDVKADTEKTETDRKRERREKKKRQKAYFKHKEEKLKALDKKGLGDKQGKEKALKELKKQAKSGRGVRVIEDNKPSSQLTSTKFFKQLQDEVAAQIQSKKVGEREAKKKDPAAKYKL